MPRTTRRRLISLAILAAGLGGLPAQALKSDSSQPIRVESDEQQADLQINKAVFTGHVIGTQGSIVLKADKAELQRDERNRLKEMRAFGAPATFKQDQDDGKVVRSQSSIIEYYPLTRTVVLIGKATFWQNDSHIDGERIEYNLDTQRMRASNPNRQGGRVQSTFMPNEFAGTGKDAGKAAPSPAAP